jgi:hypothetical protein
MPSFSEYLERKRRQFGAQFDPSKLERRFIPYFESGERISVKFSWGEVIRGTVGVTGGWVPSFLLMRTRRSLGSELLLGRQEQIVPHVPKRRPKKPRMLFNPERRVWNISLGGKVVATYRSENSAWRALVRMSKRIRRESRGLVTLPTMQEGVEKKPRTLFNMRRSRKNPACVVCHGDLVFMGQLGNLKWFRCRACGMQQSRKVRARVKKIKQPWEKNPIEPTGGGGFVVSGKAVELYRLIALKHAMKLELTTGMKMSRGMSPFRIVKQQFGWKGSKQQLYNMLVKYIDEVGPGLAKGNPRKTKVYAVIWTDGLGLRVEAHNRKQAASMAQTARRAWRYAPSKVRSVQPVIGWPGQNPLLRPFAGVKYWNVWAWIKQYGRWQFIAKVTAKYDDMKKHFPGARFSRLDLLVGEVHATSPKQVRFPMKVRR